MLLVDQVEGIRDQRVVSVHAASVHTAFLTQLGQVFTCGHKDYAGHGNKTKSDILLPMLLNSFGDRAIKEVLNASQQNALIDHLFMMCQSTQVSVGPGGYHTVAVTTSNEIFAWGHNRVGQVGYVNSPDVPRNKDGAHYLPEPIIIRNALLGESPSSIAQVIAGWGHTGVCVINFATLPGCFTYDLRSHS